MIEHSIAADTFFDTLKLASFIDTYVPKVNYTIEDSHFGRYITLKFSSEEERNSFFSTLYLDLNISDDGTYLK